MNTKFIDAFPTLVLLTKLLSKDQCQDITNYVKTLTNIHKHNLIEGDGNSNFSIKYNLIKDISNSINSCSTLFDDIDAHLKLYMENAGIAHFGIDRSWMNIQEIGSKLLKHSHPGSFITGALYFEVDENSSNLEIDNPNPFISHTPIVKQTKYTNKTISITPEIGTLVIFPSWLLHGADTVNQTKERIVISFNSGII
jgi:uncharacterized protein (TIGR02466 family)